LGYGALGGVWRLTTQKDIFVLRFWLTGMQSTFESALHKVSQAYSDNAGSFSGVLGKVMFVVKRSRPRPTRTCIVLLGVVDPELRAPRQLHRMSITPTWICDTLTSYTTEPHITYYHEQLSTEYGHRTGRLRLHHQDGVGRRQRRDRHHCREDEDTPPRQ
jgi:hypothetical protein